MSRPLVRVHLARRVRPAFAASRFVPRVRVAVHVARAFQPAFAHQRTRVAVRAAPHRLRLAHVQPARPQRRIALGGGKPRGLGLGGGAQVGRASYYSGSHTTANGGHVGAATCASRTLPFGTKVLVTNLANARKMVLTVNDRGPFVGGRIVDVSRGAAGQLGMMQSGVAPVRVEVIARR